MNERSKKILSELHPDFAGVAEDLLRNCTSENDEMVAYCGIRTPHEQARLWRRSRSTRQITQAADEMRKAGAPWLADVLLEVGPQQGRKATNALPGRSLHQHGLAIDCYWSDDGRDVWDIRTGGDQNGYRRYAEKSRRLGLVNLGASMRDWPHTQLDAGPKIAAMPWDELNERMRERFRDHEYRLLAEGDIIEKTDEFMGDSVFYSSEGWGSPNGWAIGMKYGSGVFMPARRKVFRA